MANYKSKYSGEEVDAILDMSKRNDKKNTLLIRGAPYNTTKGSVGQLAIDTYTGYNHVYKCVAVNEDGTYIWENINHPSSYNYYIKDIDMVWGTADGYGDEYEDIGVSGGLRHDEKYEVKLEMFLNNEVVFTTESWYNKNFGICIYDPVSEVQLYTIYDDSLVKDEVELLDIEHDTWRLTLKGAGWLYALDYNSQVVSDEIKNNSILPMHISPTAKRDIASYIQKSTDDVMFAGDIYSKEQKMASETYVEEYVEEKIASLVNTAPDALDTLEELAKALGNDPNFATTVLNEIGRVKSSIVNDDWSQNDETAPDYIKNRTHYTEIVDGKEKIHKLDEKYIPDSIARVADVEEILDELHAYAQNLIGGDA